jgi:hypothetical protein
MEQAKTKQIDTAEDCETCTPDYADGTTGVLSALVASSCCWLPAVAAIFGFSAVAVGQTMMAYHTPLAVLGLVAIGVAWWFFLSKRIDGTVAWSSGIVTWLVLLGSTTVVLLYSVIGWLFPSVFIYLL